MEEHFRWNDEEHRRSDYFYLNSIEPLVVDAVSDGLNKVLSTNYSVKQWKTGLGAWLNVALAVVFDRYWRVGRDVNGHDATEVDVRCLQIANDSQEFTELIESDEWNRQLVDHIGYLLAQGLEPNNPNVDSVHPYALTKQKAPQVSNYRLLARKTRRLFRSGYWTLLTAVNRIGQFASRPRLVYHATYFSSRALRLLQLRTRNKLCWIAFKPESTYPKGVDSVARKRLGDYLLADRTDDDFVRLVKNLLPKLLPTSFLENFHWIVKETLRKNPVPDASFTANSHFFFDSYKLWVMQFREKKFLAVSSEHGGGLRHLHPGWAGQASVSDIHCSSWADSDCRENRLLTPTFVGEKALKGRFKSKRLLIIAYPAKVWAFSAGSGPQGDRGYSPIEHALALTDSCAKIPSSNIRLKLPASFRKQKSQRGAVGHLLSELRVRVVKVSFRPIHKEIARARVVICTYPQTTYTQAIISGRPTLLIYDPKISVLHHSQQSLIEEMLENNMVFHNPIKAADFLARIWDNPNVWWNSQRVLALREKFLAGVNFQEEENLNRWCQFFGSLDLGEVPAEFEQAQTDVTNL